MGTMTFESEGLHIVAFLHMVAAGELCCLSDNSGYIWLALASYVVFLTTLVKRIKVLL